MNKLRYETKKNHCTSPGIGQNNFHLENVPTNAPAVPDPLSVRGSDTTYERLICHEITHTCFVPIPADEHADGEGQVTRNKRNRLKIKGNEQY